MKNTNGLRNAGTDFKAKKTRFDRQGYIQENFSEKEIVYFGYLFDHAMRNMYIEELKQLENAKDAPNTLEQIRKTGIARKRKDLLGKYLDLVASDYSPDYLEQLGINDHYATDIYEFFRYIQEFSDEIKGLPDIIRKHLRAKLLDRNIRKPGGH